ncbi:hypothetical protein LZ24_01430 [Desulfobotulus alkaliphilus]|uniref:Ethanolamine utilization protein n=1 Tax=Desulfobotulus alkaliphilus TaxID=622671 RepID=A0A562RVC6_9BACT|nr:hypothetical protein [Desulfobotulus alkaliphilus]TWI73019.1 hypothetical protein LZ24_01430 [Desulfobotulus alkaliphilus]
MDVNELVRTIAKEVLRQLQQKTEKPCVLVLAPRESSLAENLKNILEGDTDLVFSGEDYQGREPVRCILPFLSCASMADLAAGRASSGTEAGVLRLLLQGQEIEVLDFEYRAYGQSAPAPLYDLYQAYEKTLASYGLREFVRKQPDTVNFKKRLITEKDVIQAKDQGAGTIRIPMDAKVTPLAGQSAIDLDIKILKR